MPKGGIGTKRLTCEVTLEHYEFGIGGKAEKEKRTKGSEESDIRFVCENSSFG